MKILVLISLFFGSAFAEEKIPKFPVKTEISVKTLEGKDYLVLAMHNEKKWHTYWKNPGDAGQAFRFEFTENGNPVEWLPLEWKAPRKYIEPGNIIAYGYQDHYAFFFPLTDALRNKTLDLKAMWLVCKHICIPGSLKTTVQVKPGFQTSVPSEFQWQSDYQKEFQQVPRKQSLPADYKIYLTTAEKPKQFYLHYQIPKKGTADFHPQKENLIYPERVAPFGFEHEKVFQDENFFYGRMNVVWDGEYEEPPLPFPTEGKFGKPHTLRFLVKDFAASSAFQTEVTVTEVEKFNSAIKAFYSSLKPVGEKEKKSSPEHSWWLYLLYAFIGGFILNFMPCVLPVISLKLFGLIQHQNKSHKEILSHNMFYTLGILLTFWLLGFTVLLLQTLGNASGWGFHMQSPIFVLIMTVIIFTLALNMFGLFEIKTPMGNRLVGIKEKQGPLGDMTNGVIATILSTPCSAPFLGTALTFAFTTSPLNILSMFTSIGVGLAFPFILVGLFPKTLNLLPQPGNWMNTFKKVMGVLLLGTAVWLGTIFYALTAGGGVSKVGDLDWKPWSRQAMQDLRGKWVFIDFTADWCLTCKVNEKLVLNTEDFSKLVEDKKLELLLADWTKRDDRIGSFLKEHGYVAVPAYFIQKPDGSLIKLGETISIGEIEENLK